MLRTVAEKLATATVRPARGCPRLATATATAPPPPRRRFASSPSQHLAAAPTPHDPTPGSSTTTTTQRTTRPPQPQPQPQPHITAQEAADKAVEEKGTTPPKPLSRALGVREPPRKGKQSREEWRADLLNREKRIEERRHLVKEASKGYFHDYNALRHQGGKAYLAPKTLIREDLSLYFPDIEGTSLATKERVHTTDLFENKISLVVFSSFRSSEEHINSFVRPTLADLDGDSRFQYVYINLQENPLKSFLVSMFLSSLRKTVPVSQQPTYLLSHQSLEYLRGPMGMENKHVGYVFLVDANRKIRWAGCSWATVDEEEALRKCAHVLVDRLESGAGAGAGAGAGSGSVGV